LGHFNLGHKSFAGKCEYLFCHPEQPDSRFASYGQDEQAKDPVYPEAKPKDPRLLFLFTKAVLDRLDLPSLSIKVLLKRRPFMRSFLR
jgi:hypothetical protein